MKSRVLFINNEQLSNEDLFEEYNIEEKEEYEFKKELKKIFYMLLHLEEHYIKKEVDIVKKYAQEEYVISCEDCQLDKDIKKVCEYEGVSEEFIRAIAVLFMAKVDGRKNEKAIANSIVVNNVKNNKIRNIVDHYVKKLKSEKQQVSLKSQYSKNSQQMIMVSNIVEAYRRTIAFNPKKIEAEQGDNIEHRITVFKETIIKLYDELSEEKIKDIDAIKGTEMALQDLEFDMKYVKKNQRQKLEEPDSVNINEVISGIFNKLNKLKENAQDIIDLSDKETESYIKECIDEIFSAEQLNDKQKNEIQNIINDFRRYYTDLADIVKLENKLIELFQTYDTDYPNEITELCKRVKKILMTEEQAEDGKDEEYYRKKIMLSIQNAVKGIEQYLKIYYNENRGITYDLKQIIRIGNDCQLAEIPDLIEQLKKVLRKINIKYIENFEKKNIITDSKSRKKLAKTKKFLSEKIKCDRVPEKERKDMLEECFSESLEKVSKDSLSGYCTEEYVKDVFNIRRRLLAKKKNNGNNTRENKFYIWKKNPEIALMTYKFYGSNIDNFDVACIILDSENIEKLFILDSTMSWNGKGNRVNVKDGTDKYYKGEYLFTSRNRHTLMNRIYGNDEESSCTKESKALADRFRRKGALYDYRRCMIQSNPSGKIEYKKECADIYYITEENKNDFIGSAKDVNQKSIIYLDSDSEVIKFFENIN